MTNTEMIERVARAIRDRYAAVGVGCDIDFSEALAYVAIAAMREPTEEMREAGNGAARIDVLFDDPGGPKDIWKAMLDAILKEHP